MMYVQVFRLGSRLVDAMMDLNIAMMEMVPPSTGGQYAPTKPA